MAIKKGVRSVNRFFEVLNKGKLHTLINLEKQP